MNHPAVQQSIYSVKFRTVGPVAAIGVGAWLAWFVGSIGMGLWWALLVVPAYLLYAKLSVDARLRRAIDKYENEWGSKKETLKESVEWLNNALRVAWPTYEPMVQKIVEEQSRPHLDKSCPKFLEKIAIENIKMGTHPPTFSEFIVQPPSVPNKIIMDATMTWNSDISVDVAVYHKGKRYFITVSHVYLKARARVTSWLIPHEPFTSKVRISILETPEVDVQMRLMEYGPDLFNIPAIVPLVKTCAINLALEILGYPYYFDVDVAPEYYIADDEWPEEDVDTAQNILMRGFGAITGGVGALAGGIGGAVTGVGGAITGGVGAVAGGVGGIMSGGMKKIGLKKSKSKDAVDHSAVEK